MPTPNMNLTVPIVGITPGPDYANQVNGDFNILDSHDHSTGKGVPITPAGMQISSDLNFQNNNATTLRTARFSSQTAPLSAALDLGCVYNVLGDLYYNDGSGTQIRITESGAVAGTPGSISNLVSPASAGYNAVTDTFVWQSNTNVPAHLDAGNLVMHNFSGTYANKLTLTAPTLSSSYALTLPTIPGQEQFLSIDTSGNILSHWFVDNSTIQLTSNQLSVKSGGITTTQISATAGITGGQIAQNTITGGATGNIASATITSFNLAPGTFPGVFSSVGNGGGLVSGSADIQSVTITPLANRPVFCAFVCNNSVIAQGISGSIRVDAAFDGNARATITSEIAQMNFSGPTGGSPVTANWIGSASCNCFVFPTTTNSVTFYLAYSVTSASFNPFTMLVYQT